MSATDAIAEPPGPPNRARQLRLFRVPNPLTARLGEAFFRALPQAPGVYFFHDESGRLLYVGQSNNLRARIGSYRHVSFERHPRRTLRLVHQVRRIEWQLCDSPVAAIERERELLLALRPPFNRAGVWQGQPWWLHLEARDAVLRFWLSRGEVTATATSEVPHQPAIISTALIEADPVCPLAGHLCFGPYRAEFPFVYAALIRTALRACRTGLLVADYPAGWLDARRLAEARIEAGLHVAPLAEQIESLLRGEDCGLIPKTDPAPLEADGPVSVEGQLLQQDVETLQEFFARQQISEAGAETG